MTVLTVTSEQAGERLDSFLTYSWDAAESRSQVQKTIQNGDVKVDGKLVTRSSTKVNEGQRVSITSAPSNDQPMVATRDIPLDVVYEDDHIAVIDKPFGVAVHPGAGHVDDTLVNGAVQRWPHLADVGESDRPGIIHRLDKDTSGLMILGLSAYAHQRLLNMIKNREITRIYTAVVHGIPDQREGIVDAPIGRSKHNRLKQAVKEDGRPSRTHYRVDYELGDFAYLEIKLETGRMHQIRVHMEAIGHPVIGDQTYGRSRKIPGLNRQFLHASRLEFAHPISKKPVLFTSELPEDLQRILRTLN